MPVKLFIGGFPLETGEMTLAQLIALHGKMEVMKIVRDKKTRIFKGYAFEEAAINEDAIAVMVTLDGEQMSKRKMSVKLVDVPVLQVAKPPVT